MAMIHDFFALFSVQVYTQFLHSAWISLPFWLPTTLLFVFAELWMNYKRREYIKKQGSTLFEIKLPRDMWKSPAAMENFLTALHSPGVGNIINVYLDGRTRPWWSLEIVSIDGVVHFFIWCQEKQKHIVQNQLYAQFPEVEVHEVPDYSLGIHFDTNKFNFGWFGQMNLTKDQSYPIKTYISYGLDKNDKEEYKIDPLSHLLEYMGGLKRGEQAWIQILIQAHTKENIKYGRIFEKPDWKKSVDETVKKFVKDNAIVLDKPDKEGKVRTATMRDLTQDQQEDIYTIQRNQGKWPFDTMIRMTYFAEKDAFNPVNIGGLINSWKQFSSQGLNGFKPMWHSGYDYAVFQDYKNFRKNRNTKKLLEAYKRRSFFNVPFKNFHGNSYVLTTEELATLYHFPSAIVAATPTLTRIPSKRAEAPANLPI